MSLLLTPGFGQNGNFWNPRRDEGVKMGPCRSLDISVGISWEAEVGEHCELGDMGLVWVVPLGHTSYHFLTVSGTEGEK